MKKVLLLLLSAVLILLMFGGCKKDVDWKVSLENFLTKFPTMLTIADNRDVIVDFENGIIPGDAEGICLPFRCRFQDLDGDDLPEAIISFGPPESEIMYDKIYKFYGDSYGQIGGGEKKFEFYKNQNGKLVAETRNGYMADGVYFADIKDKKLILTDYIDSNGGDNYNGVKYANLPELYDTMDVWSAKDLDGSLELWGEIDCSDIVSAAINRINS